MLDVLQSEKDWLEAAEVLKVLRPNLQTKAFVEDRLRLLAEGYRLVGVRVDNQVVAVASYIITPHPTYYRELQIHDMATLPKHQSHGYGAKLLVEIEKIAAKDRCGRCYVNSRTVRDAAHRFYKRNGYVQYSIGFVKLVTERRPS